MKKVISFVLALSLVLALGVPAFAAADTDINTASGLTSGATTAIAGTTEGITIDVKVPKAGSVTVNPYNLSVTPSGGTATTDTIISATQRIQSKTKAPLAVSVTLEGKPAGDAKLVGTPQRSTATPVAGKNIFLGFEIVDEGVNATLPSSEPTWKVVLEKRADGSNELKLGADAKAAVVSATATKNEKMVTLAASDGTKISSAAFHLLGDTGIDPANPWASTDKVDVNITFTFGLLNNKAAS